MKFRNPFQSAIKRNFLKEAELKLYEKVAKDIENNDINNGVWTKAFAKSNGDVAKQKSIYIELMVELYEDRLRAEEELEVILASAANKEKAEKQKQEAQKQSRSKSKSASDLAAEEAEKTRLAKKHYEEKYLNSTESYRKIREANRAKSEAIRKENKSISDEYRARNQAIKKENKAKSEAFKEQRKAEGKKDKSNLVMPILLGLVAIITISFFLYEPAPVDKELEMFCEIYMADDDGSIDEPLMDTLREVCK
jgi:thiol:disulfide interchange protein